MAEGGRKVNPQSLTSMVLGICATGWLIFFVEFYYFVSGVHIVSNSVVVYVFAALLFSGLTNYLYSLDDRYLEVYNRSKYSAPKARRNRAMVFSWVFIFLPYLLLLLFLF
jgi:hypothetical protein